MNTERNTISWGYFLGWALATLFGLVVAGIVFFVAASALGRFSEFVGGLIMACSFGTVIGVAQWGALRRHVRRAAAWIGATLLGLLIGGTLMFEVTAGADPFTTPLAKLGQAAILGSALGVAQWFALRKEISRAALWIGISFVSWIAAGLIGILLNSLSYEWGPVLYWLGLFFVGAVLPVAGGMWLFDQSAAAAA